MTAETLQGSKVRIGPDGTATIENPWVQRAETVEGTVYTIVAPSEREAKKIEADIIEKDRRAPWPRP